MQGYIFWDTIPCSPVKVNRRFGRTCRLRNVGRFSPAYTDFSPEDKTSQPLLREPQTHTIIKIASFLASLAI
jgi:hypothetical protein